MRPHVNKWLEPDRLDSRSRDRTERSETHEHAARTAPESSHRRDSAPGHRGWHLRRGAKLPSERVLASTYGAARNTAREAINILATEGLVDVRHGSGATCASRSG